MAVTSGNSKLARIRLPEPPRSTGGVRRPSTVGYWVALLIALGGLVGGLVWGVTAYVDLQSQIDGFARFSVHGEALVRIDATGGRVLYYEGPGSLVLSDLDVRITDPGGADVRVEEYGADLRYDGPNESVGRAIGTFEASAAGRYEVTVDGTAPQGAHIAVGDSIAGSKLGSIVGALLLVVVTGAAGLVLAIMTGVRPSRR